VKRVLLLILLLLLVAGAWLYGFSGACAPALTEGPRPPLDAADPLTPRRAAPITEDSLRALLEQLPPDRPIGSPGHAATRAWLLSTLRSLGLQPRLLPFPWAGAPQADLANIEVRVPGARPDAPLVLFSAHYDSVAGTPGADDNGSGTVVLLELARRLSAGGYPHELGLLFFDAEEPGLLGSGAYAQSLPEADARRLLGLVNLETMGYTDRSPASQLLPAGAELVFDPGDRGDFLLCLGNFPRSAPLCKVVGDALALEASPLFRAEVFAWLPANGLELPDTRRSDHAQFWDRGYAAVLLTDTANLRSRHYHSATDAIETLDLPFLAAGARGVERAARVLLRSTP
jgi:aminopeptidase YwaD